MKKGDIKYYGTKKVMIVEPCGTGGAVVQEIYIEGEKEFPAGPTFFASKFTEELPKTITWEGKRMIQEEELYAKKKTELERVYKDIQIQVEVNQAILKDLKLRAKNISAGAFKRLLDFVAGNIKYVAFIDRYEVLPLDKSIEAIDNWHGRKFDGIKLLALFGRTDGDLEFRINVYYDGSGGYCVAHPCSTIEEGRKLVQANINRLAEENKHVDIKKVIELGYTLPVEYLMAIYKKADEGRAKELEEHGKKCNEYRQPTPMMMLIEKALKER